MKQHFESARKPAPLTEGWDDLDVEEISHEEASALVREGKARWAAFEDLADRSNEVESNDLIDHRRGLRDRVEGLRDSFADDTREEFSGKVRVVQNDPKYLQHLQAKALGRVRDNNVAANDNIRAIDHLREDDLDSPMHDLLQRGAQLKAKREAEERRKLEDKNRLRRAQHQTFMDRISRRGDALELENTPEAIHARESQRSVDQFNRLLSGASAQERENEDREFDAFFKRMSLEREPSRPEKEKDFEGVALEFNDVQRALEDEVFQVNEALSREEFIQQAKMAGEGAAGLAEKEALVREAADAAEKMRAEKRNAERKAAYARLQVFNLAALILAGILGKAATERQVQEFMRDQGVEIVPTVKEGTRLVDRGVERYAVPFLDDTANVLRQAASTYDKLTGREDRTEESRRRSLEEAEAKAYTDQFNELVRRSEASGESYEEREDFLREQFRDGNKLERLVAHRDRLSIPAENELQFLLLTLKDDAQSELADAEESDSASRAETEEALYRYDRLLRQMGPTPHNYYHRAPTKQQLNRLARGEE